MRRVSSHKWRNAIPCAVSVGLLLALQRSGYRNVPLAMALTILSVAALVYWVAGYESVNRWGASLYARHSTKYPKMTLSVAILIGAMLGGMTGGGSYFFVRTIYQEHAQLQTAKQNPPFSIDIETALFAPHRNKTCCFWMLFKRQREFMVMHTNAALFVRIKNVQTRQSMVDKLEFEIKVNGRWEKAHRVDTRFGEIYFVSKDLREASLIDQNTQFLDRVIADHNFMPREAVRGWVLLDYPSDGGEANPEFRVFISDVAGRSYISDPIRSEYISAESTMQGSILKISDIKTDLSGFTVRYFNDRSE